MEIGEFRVDKFGDYFCTARPLGNEFPASIRILVQEDDTTALAKKIFDDRGPDPRRGF